PICNGWPRAWERPGSRGGCQRASPTAAVPARQASSPSGSGKRRCLSRCGRLTPWNAQRPSCRSRPATAANGPSGPPPRAAAATAATAARRGPSVRRGERVLVAGCAPGRTGARHPAARCRHSTSTPWSTTSMVSCMATKKVTVTIPEELLEEIRGEAGERGLSAYVADALRLKRDRDRLVELVDWLQEEHGAVTDEERAAAREELQDLDAEHERRRTAARKPRAGEAA